MISHRHKLIFIHIPKCAGTSIEAAFGHLDGHLGRQGQDHRSIRMIEAPIRYLDALSSAQNARELYRRASHRLRPAQNWRNKLSVTAAQYSCYFKFTFVRNPWARAVSLYGNVMRDPIHQRNMGVSPSTTFATFLDKQLGRGLLRPQLYWLRDFAGRIPMDFIGRFENLSADFARACELAGVAAPSLPHEIRGGGGGYRGFYDENSRNVVAQYYHEEIELFGYSFEEGETKVGHIS